MLSSPETAPKIYDINQEDIYYVAQEAHKREHTEMVERKKEMKIYLRFNERLISKDNEKICNRQGRFFLSAKFKSFENRIKWEAKSQYKSKILLGNLQVLIIAYYKNRVHPDLFNLPKSCCDALNKIIWQDDRQIKKGMVEVVENSEKEYFEIYIKE